jgi:hypothetical protein
MGAQMIGRETIRSVTTAAAVFAGPWMPEQVRHDGRAFMGARL